MEFRTSGGSWGIELVESVPATLAVACPHHAPEGNVGTCVAFAGGE